MINPGFFCLSPDFSLGFTHLPRCVPLSLSIPRLQSGVHTPSSVRTALSVYPQTSVWGSRTFLGVYRSLCLSPDFSLGFTHLPRCVPLSLSIPRLQSGVHAPPSVCTALSVYPQTSVWGEAGVGVSMSVVVSSSDFHPQVDLPEPEVFGCYLQVFVLPDILHVLFKGEPAGRGDGGFFI